VRHRRSAHANTIRSLMAHFDDVSEAEVPNLHVPNSVPILYRFERGSQRLISTKLQGAAGGSHPGGRRGRRPGPGGPMAGVVEGPTAMRRLLSLSGGLWPHRPAARRAP
jgi:hypothetical protein